ncbi:MAG TPA: hypothetical protein VGB65_10025 [Allosphingosinicella sp.]|jgi:hypothetical protein
MATAQAQHCAEQAFAEAVLPALPLMLDSLLDAASLARPGIDAEHYADDLRALAAELEALTRQVEALSSQVPAYRAA